MVTVSDEDFPELPGSPCKSPAAKNALYRMQQTKNFPTTQDNMVISTLSQLINAQADAIEKLMSENSAKIDN